MAQTFEQLDFEVLLYKNIGTREKMINAIREFGNKLDQYDVTCVYYAGHGIQLNEINYLIPTEVQLEDESSIDDFCVNANTFMRYLEQNTKQNKTHIIILDACRDNPFENSWSRSLAGKGLVQMNQASGTLIAYSTEYGKTAEDGWGVNSTYCTSLNKYMLTPNITIEQIFKNVRTDVSKKTNNKQTPVETTKLIGNDFYFIKTEKKANKTLNRFEIEEFLNKYYNTIESKSINNLQEYYTDTVKYFFDFHNISSDSIMDVSKYSFNKYIKTKHEIDWRTLEIHKLSDNMIGLTYEMDYFSKKKESEVLKNYNLRLYVKVKTNPFKIYSIYEVFIN